MSDKAALVLLVALAVLLLGFLNILFDAAGRRAARRTTMDDLRRAVAALAADSEGGTLEPGGYPFVSVDMIVEMVVAAGLDVEHYEPLDRTAKYLIVSRPGEVEDSA